jgi:4-amino-4-deoxy-L-arabinose transferase-like glycosyltransferase
VFILFLRKLKTGAQEHHIFISRRLLLKMLASYLAVALLPLLFSNIQYLRQVDKAFETEKQEISTILRQSRDRYDEEISALEKVYTIVISDSELLNASLPDYAA